jgi:hypothetical protein
MRLAGKSIAVVARAGYGARGVVYLIIGGLSILAALGTGGGDTVGSKGALTKLLEAPWGVAIVVALAIGFFAYALWRAIQAILDADDHGTDAKGLVVRASLMVSAITHTLLGLYALSLPFTIGGFGQDSGGGGSAGAVGWLLQQPFGVYLLAAVGLCIVGAGVAQQWKGVSGKFRERLDMSPALEKALTPVCAFGLVARGVVFVIVGGFFLYAAYRYDPDQAGGLSEALRWLREQEFGQALFFVVAAGLLSFGIYSLIEAGWRTVSAGEAIRGTPVHAS